MAAGLLCPSSKALMDIEVLRPVKFLKSLCCLVELGGLEKKKELSVLSSIGRRPVVPVLKALMDIEVLRPVKF